MPSSSQHQTILMADDDGEDCGLVRDALRAIGRDYDLRFVHNGEELFDYLTGREEYAEAGELPRPDLILMDLKMPRKDGRETLRELKSDPQWRQIPVIVMTTSTARDDVRCCYEAGANAYVTKPATFRKLVDMLDKLTTFWFEVAQLPPNRP
jgi:CheY-like chemotaxis protein